MRVGVAGGWDNGGRVYGEQMLGIECPGGITCGMTEVGGIGTLGRRYMVSGI